MKSKSATLEDVARHAGVSYQTVSRVLNKSANVSEATRRKVEKSIEALRYVPNRLAQQLVGKESQTVGLVTISLAWHAPSQVAAAVKRYANLEGYQVLISMIDESVNQSIQDSINELKSQRVDKVIINVPLETEQAQKIAADNDDIVCLFLDVDPYSSVFNVSFNPADGTRASVKYLYEMGHREIALLAGPDSSVSAKLRLKSWLETLDGYGLKPVTSCTATGMRRAATPARCRCCAKRLISALCWWVMIRWRWGCSAPSISIRWRCRGRSRLLAMTILTKAPFSIRR